MTHRPKLQYFFWWRFIVFSILVQRPGVRLLSRLLQFRQLQVEVPNWNLETSGYGPYITTVWSYSNTKLHEYFHNVDDLYVSHTLLPCA